MIRNFILALALGTSSLAVSIPAFAQTSEGVAADPVRLKLAEQVAGRLIPPGTYQKLMKDMADQMANGMIEQMLGMDAATLASAAGEDSKNVEGKSLGELASDADPHFKERTDIMMKVMFDEMGKLMSAMEPTARSALAKVYARKYDVRQLTDLNSFFATSSGNAFAADFFATFSDKEMISAMMGEMPKMIEAMPAIMKKVEEATAHLPPPPNTDAEMAAEENPESYQQDDDLFANETGEEPWYQDQNWTAGERKAVSKLGDIYTRTSEKSEAAYAAFEEAQRNAIAAARQKFLAQGWVPETLEEPMAAEDIPANAVPPPALPQ